MKHAAFASRSIVGIRLFGYQVDWRDRLPFSMRLALAKEHEKVPIAFRLDRGWYVLRLGTLGYLTGGKCISGPRSEGS